MDGKSLGIRTLLFSLPGSSVGVNMVFIARCTFFLNIHTSLCCMTSFEIFFTTLKSKYSVFDKLASASCLSAMAEASPEIEQEVKKLLCPSCPLGINIRLKNVLAILEDKGMVYKSVLCPSSLMCHPQNRGGSMINAYNCHRKGQDIVACGVKAELLAPNSLAVEMSLDPIAKSHQIACNQKMISEAKGLLAPLQGGERFCTLANSHFVQWARALEHGCIGPDGHQLTPPVDMKPLLQNGWSWTVISNEAERQFPNLPAFAAMAMNSHNSTQIASNELECMMQLSELYSGGMKLDDAVKAVLHSAPACKAYLDDVGYFCKNYTGGESFPLLKCLDTFCNLTDDKFVLVSKANPCLQCTHVCFDQSSLRTKGSDHPSQAREMAIHYSLEKR